VTKERLEREQLAEATFKPNLVARPQTPLRRRPQAPTDALHPDSESEVVSTSPRVSNASTTPPSVFERLSAQAAEVDRRKEGRSGIASIICALLHCTFYFIYYRCDLFLSMSFTVLDDSISSTSFAGRSRGTHFSSPLAVYLKAFSN
jgi:hypothetical protein